MNSGPGGGGSTSAGGTASDASRLKAEQDPMGINNRAGSPTLHVAQLGRDYAHGENLFRASLFTPYRRNNSEPMYRPLRIYMADPVESGYAGRTAIIQVPYEPLGVGPVGSFLAVSDAACIRGQPVGFADLEDRNVIINQGLRPSSADPLFHQQMVYAVCSDVAATFTGALGRDLSWGFDSGVLKLRPHFDEERNAYYDQANGEIRFGYFNADLTPSLGVLPHGTIYTCLSHDIIVHEMTHALLDGMRANFHQPTNPDVLAFHEGFADLVAILQHFAHADIVQDAIERTAGKLGEDETIFSLARQFGEATGKEGPLRIALGGAGVEPMLYGQSAEPHERGLVLVGAVMDALSRVYERRAAPVKTLIASLGRSDSPLHPACVELLTNMATKTAGQFLALCIRAIDYCPPVDIRFGEYLRALITADHDLVEDDRSRFRGELIAAFARRQIFPEDVPDISEDTLLWKAPALDLPEITGLRFDALQLRPDPGQTPDGAEIEREAGALADVLTDPRFISEFGLTAYDGNEFGLPTIESIRILRRVGPDRQVRFGLVCEVLQTRIVSFASGDTLAVVGGSTIIMDGAGRIRFVIRKAINRSVRVQADLAYAMTAQGKAQRFAMNNGCTWKMIHADQRGTP